MYLFLVMQKISLYILVFIMDNLFFIDNENIFMTNFEAWSEFTLEVSFTNMYT